MLCRSFPSALRHCFRDSLCGRPFRRLLHRRWRGLHAFCRSGPAASYIARRFRSCFLYGRRNFLPGRRRNRRKFVQVVAVAFVILIVRTEIIQIVLKGVLGVVLSGGIVVILKSIFTDAPEHGSQINIVEIELLSRAWGGSNRLQLFLVAFFLVVL